MEGARPFREGGFGVDVTIFSVLLIFRVVHFYLKVFISRSFSSRSPELLRIDRGSRWSRHRDRRLRSDPKLSADARGDAGGCGVHFSRVKLSLTPFSPRSPDPDHNQAQLNSGLSHPIYDSAYSDSF